MVGNPALRMYLSVLSRFVSFSSGATDPSLLARPVDSLLWVL
jgi:hypothetical protein